VPWELHPSRIADIGAVNQTGGEMLRGDHFSDSRFLNLLDRMLEAGLTEHQINEAFDDWFGLELLLQDGVLNLTKETLAEVARRFGWIQGGVTAFLESGLPYPDYCERRNRRKRETIEEHHRSVVRHEVALPVEPLTPGRAGGEFAPRVALAPSGGPHPRDDHESVPRRAPRLRPEPPPPPPPPPLLSNAGTVESRRGGPRSAEV
jgi:hypothetical protein